METGIIGLGEFGLQLGKVLTSLGQVCLGLDISPDRAQQARDHLSQVLVGDATDKTVLSQISIHTMDTVVVALGDKLEPTILTIMNLQELGLSRIIARAASPLYKKVLERMGLMRIIQPEIDAATRLAYSLDNPGLLELLPIGRGVALQEMEVDRWRGKTLRELNVRDVSNILVTAVRAKGSGDYCFVPDPDKKLQPGDTLLVIGYADKIARLRDRT